MLPTTMALIAALALVAANAFFVASEFAMVKMRPTRLEQLVAAKVRGAKTALDISRRLDAYLSANQLGITLASLGLGWLGEPAFAYLLEPLLSPLGLSPRAASGIAFATGFVILTFLHTVLGELAPKSLAIQRTEVVALWTAAPLHAFYLAAYPLIWTLNKSAALALRLVRLKPASEADMVHSPEELRMLLRRLPIDAGARRFMDRVFDYTQRIARHVMILRDDVVTLIAGRPFEENVRLALANQYTRYPLVDQETDRVLGYIHLKDLVAALAQGKRPDLRELARQPVSATEEMPIEQIRQAFQRQRVHLAVVRDREGVFTGIVTLEDLLEEMVGEIQDEHDGGELPPIIRLPERRFEVDGRLTLDVAERDLGLKFHDVPAGVETLGGFVMARFGVLPRRGQSVSLGGMRLTVLAVRNRRIARLRGEPIPEPPPPPPEV
ncbi:MAG: HlyC/CorC family transporter [Myxococcales bacterium]|nr:HlyC/CorC family transporter [Myxococcales bacterium]